MAFPQGPFSGMRARRSPSDGDRDGGLVLGIGRRAFATGGAKGVVALTDDNGSIVLGTLEDGDEVEVLAWVPRRSATRYRVQSTKDHALQGWLGAASLRVNKKREVPSAEAAAQTPAQKWVEPNASGQSDPVAPPKRTRKQPPKHK
jgi:hypothetical protein